MNLDKLFPYRVFVSRLAREDRRQTLMPRLTAIGLGDARWFPAIECDVLKGDTRGFFSLAKRSCAIGKRLVLREAGRSRVPNVLFLEDDVVFHTEFNARVEALQLPDDWGLFYFGCQHAEPPQWISAGVVRINRALDMHAVAINAKYFLQVRKAMRGHGKGTHGKLHSDVLLSYFHKSIPTYAAFPNLAWQAKGYSDNTRTIKSYYYDDGRQKPNAHLLSHL